MFLKYWNAINLTQKRKKKLWSTKLILLVSIAIVLHSRTFGPTLGIKRKLRKYCVPWVQFEFISWAISLSLCVRSFLIFVSCGDLRFVEWKSLSIPQTLFLMFFLRAPWQQIKTKILAIIFSLILYCRICPSVWNKIFTIISQ